MMLSNKLSIQDKITDAIARVKTIENCRNIGHMIDSYETDCPNDQRFLFTSRNNLCNKTFEVHKDSHKFKACIK
jgi:hypothetical protein